MRIIYPDNPIIRSLSDKPEVWNQLYDQFVNTFGRTFKPIQSYYLFFEYIGFTKKLLEIPLVFAKPYFDATTKLAAIDLDRGVREEELLILDKNLSEIDAGISIYIKQKLYSLKPTFDQLIKERKKRISSFRAAQELVDALFGDIFFLLESEFEEFVQYATTYLAWDSFCSIHPLGLPLRAVRERQLGFWLKSWEQGIKLPLGKIVDDQSNYYKMNFESHFKEFEDMVDAEMHTYLILGYEIDDQLHPVDCLMYPPKDRNAIFKRNELVLGSVTNIQKTLNKEIAKFPGKIYSLDDKTHCFLEINEPMFSLPS